MKNYYLILLSVFILSCNNERVLLLPEVEHAEITEVLDVSPAYIFYDETQPDSVLLNRKNLISTTNWLVNVDKRLTLKQAIPHIKFLQDKKRDAKMHKNENAKNYFTCNDTSIGDLGFIEFTDIYYEFSENHDNNLPDIFKVISADLNENMKISEKFSQISMIIDESNKDTFSEILKSGVEILEMSAEISSNIEMSQFTISYYFHKNLSFQDYITIKSKLSQLEIDKTIINNHEFIF